MPNDTATPFLTGLLPIALLLASLLALPVSHLLLRFYRRAVLAEMNALAGAAAPPPAPDVPHRQSSGTLRVVELDHAAPVASSEIDEEAIERVVCGPWRAAAVYASAGLVYAGIMAAGASNADGLQGNWLQIAVLFWIYAWPGVLAVILVAAYDRSRRLQVLGAYVGVLAILAMRADAGNLEVGLLDVPKAWVLNAPGTLLLVTFLWWRIRAVGPMVLAFLLVAAIGSQAVLWLAGEYDAVLRAAVAAGEVLGQNAARIFWGLVLVGALGFAIALGRPLLRWMGRRYRAKAFSDRGLTIDALFVVFAVTHSVFLVFQGASWFLTGVAAFAGYAATARLGFRRVARRRGRPLTLLLLRVFRLGVRSARLFEKLRRHWQEVGSISMVAGPDLVTALIEPDEFLDYVAGSLGHRFVSSSAELERRVAIADRAPDPDGRYRINEFFCRGDTWQVTMRTLASTSDVVLMDLRSFSSSNRGCLDEIGYLLDGVDLARVVFLVDASTNGAFLEASLQQQWRRTRSDSPNRHAPQPTARLFRVHRQSEQELVALLRHMLANTLRSPDAGKLQAGHQGRV